MKAFPYTGAGTDGMDLRDYFAAKAMQGMLACKPGWGVPHEDLLSKEAYQIAEAMMKARENHE